MAPDTRSARIGSAGPDDPAPNVRAAQTGIFRKEGEYWTVGYAGNAFRLKDTKGLGYLAHLLRHPGVEFHVLDLVGGIAGQHDDDETGKSGLPRGEEDLEKAGIHVTTLGDAGEMLDEQAKLAYRRRLSELREELEEAKELGNVERAERAEQEFEALTKELSRAVGLGGRNRRAASASERARQSITKTIKAVLERIAEANSRLGDMLSRCIKTGTFCSYQPDPEFPIGWEFAATNMEPEVQRAEPPISDGAQRSSNGHSNATENYSAASGADFITNRGHAAASVLEVSPYSLALRTAFAGRENERRAIRAVIDRALGGHGSVVMLGGGPGVGKSRLAMEMSEYASRVGFRILVGHCYERDEPFPYLPFVEILESGLANAPSLDDYRRRMGDSAPEFAQIAPSLRRVFPDIPQPLDLPPAQQRRYLFQSVSEGLARATRSRSYLYVLEDLQWADESSLALVIHLTNRIANLPVVIIGTYRDGYSEHNDALVRTLEELIRLGIRPLKLGGLSKDDIAQMLHGLSQREAPESLVSAIFEESQGNPFFVEEVYRHLIEDGKVFDTAGQFRPDITIDEIDVPENVRLIIGRRLERLDENEKRVLTAAAVIGRSFSFQLLTGISQIDVDELFDVIDKAQEMGIIVPSSEGPERPYTFAHELVRQTLLAEISGPRRQQLHAGVADAIERLGRGGVNQCAGEIADHLLKAGSFADRGKLVRCLARAGESALESAAFEEARRSFRSALSHLSEDGGAERADLLSNLAMAELGLEHWDAALADLREVLEIYAKLGDREIIGKSYTDLTDALIWVGRFAEATETAHRGLAYLGSEVSANRARLLAAVGQSTAASSGYESAYEALGEAFKIASELSDPRLEARILGARSVVNLHFFRLREAAADGFLSEEMGGSDTPPWQRALQLRVLHQTLVTLGQPNEAIKIADELEPLAIKIGQAYSVALCLSTRTWAEFGKKPDIAKLEAGFQEVAKSDQKVRFSFWEVLSEVQLSLVDFIRGNWAAALAHAQAASHQDPGLSTIRSLGEGALFRQMAYAGDRASALAIFQGQRKWLPVSGQNNVRGAWWLVALAVEGLAILGEQSQAGQLYPLTHKLIDTGAVALWPISRFTQTIAGIAAAAAREFDAAENHFQIAMR
ncbi:MAG TPA: AAA family ATPase, partial [Methylomirabilota bacterium]|nr:AAA family ATPase [Methylomirabilota bacterium]